MNRRLILKSLGVGTGHALFPSVLSGFLIACNQSNQETVQPIFFKPDEMDMITQLIDIIIPATRTSSASQVLCHQFLDEVFAKCLEPEIQQSIREGLQKSIPEFQAAQNKEVYIKELDEKAYRGDENASWFIPVKQYTLVGFFTSQEGETKASHYVPIPGEYQGDIPLKEDTLNYGFTSLRYYL